MKNNLFSYTFGFIVGVVAIFLGSILSINAQSAEWYYLAAGVAIFIFAIGLIVWESISELDRDVEKVVKESKERI